MKEPCESSVSPLFSRAYSCHQFITLIFVSVELTHDETWQAVLSGDVVLPFDFRDQGLG